MLSIYEHFYAQVESFPTLPAIVTNEKKELSYAELNEKVVKLSRYLQEVHHVSPGDCVALHLSKGDQIVVAILAILRLSAAYVPLDPTYPAKRMEYIVKDTNPKCIIGDDPHHAVNTLASERNVPMYLLKDFSEFSTIKKRGNQFCGTLFEKALAYVIYTSGSTGFPKGVMIPQEGVINLCKNSASIFGICDRRFVRGRKQEKILAFSNYVFDAHVWTIFTCLLNGHTLYFPDPSFRINFSALQQYIEHYNISIALLPPAILDPDHPLRLKTLIVGGEKVTAKQVRGYLKRGTRVYNAYGPTETTVIASVNTNLDQDRVDVIGKPIANTEMHLLDRDLQSVQQGELYIGGKGVALGYLNNLELTQENFISVDILKARNPDFTSSYDRLYKTGDIARKLPNGEFEFVGRNDSQIKLRGYRIEIGEIETTLNECPHVKKGIVLVSQSPKIDEKSSTNHQLVAFFIPHQTSNMKKEVRAYLHAHIPAYMVPSQIIEIRKFPLNRSGKVDTKKLLRSLSLLGEEIREEGFSHTEEILAKIWSDFLGVSFETLGKESNFFELGGNSLLAMRMSVRLSIKLKKGVFSQHLLHGGTIANIAAEIDQLQEQPSLPQREDNGKEAILSQEQLGIFFIDQLSKNSAYHVPVVFEVSAERHFKPSVLQKVLEKIVNRHEILRTNFRLDPNGIPYQYIGPAFQFPSIEMIRVRSEEELQNVVSQRVNIPFDLQQDCLIRAVILQLGAKQYVLLTFHHIIFDGYSVDILLKEIICGVETDTPRLLMQYRDFCLMEDRWLKSEEGKSQLQYWVTQLNEFQNLALPLDYSRPPVASFEGMNDFFTLDETLSDGLKALAQKCKVTLFSVMLSAFYLLMECFSQQEDLVVGVPFANRNYPGVGDLIGYFVNALPIRCQIRKEASIHEFIQEVNELMIQAHLRHAVPFQQIVKNLEVSHDLSINPIFQVMFGFEQFGRDAANSMIRKLDLNIEKDTSARFDLSLLIDDGEPEIKSVFNFATSLLKRSTIHSMVETYRHILEQFSLSSEFLLREIQYVKSHQKQEICPFQAQEQCIHHLFEHQVDANPTVIAVISEGETFSYFQINSWANQLARQLKKEGVQCQDRVGFFLENREQALVAILAILKLGATYIPFDPETPQSRLKIILDDLQPKLLLVSTLKDFGFMAHPTVEFDIGAIASFSNENLDEKCSAHDLAYIIYTSGSTGFPKGVMIEHHSVVNYIRNIDCAVHFFQKRVDFSTNIAFDLSVTNTLAALCCGAIVCVYHGHLLDLQKYQHHLLANKVQILKLLPSYFSLLVDTLNLSAVETVIFGGEKLSSSLIRKLQNKNAKVTILDEYGPTEATVGACLSIVSSPEDHNIGYPYENIRCFVMDEENRLLPMGAKGELYLGGLGIARGYLNQEALTNEKFITSPFLKNEKLYRTGDIVRKLESGELEFLGRKDHQVKVYGYRVELEEVECYLNRHPEVEKSLIEFQPDQNELIGYYQLKKGSTLLSESLHAFLCDCIPTYMIPHQLIQVEQIKLTSNGKIDRKQKPKLIHRDVNVQKELQQLWAELLNLPVAQVSQTTPFFQMGGNSLLVLRLKKMLDMRWSNVSLIDLFRFTTIETLGAFLKDRKMATAKEKPINVVTIERGNQIAVIGFSGAFSNSDSVNEFWNHLKKGEDTLTRKSLQECQHLPIEKDLLQNEDFVPVCGEIENFQHFDCCFWGISSKAAKLMHPQVRKFLEHCYHALEHAGCVRERANKDVGVFAGMSTPYPYYQFLQAHAQELISELSDWEQENLIDQGLISTQAAYHLGLRGVALDINTACSTSLVAIIEACKNLRLRQCDLALAGGASLPLPFQFGDLAKEGLIFSKRGICSVFDQSADGTVRGAGVGVVVLKRLEDALAEKDHVIAVIEGVGTNNDGNRKVGFTAPSPEGQSECIQKAIQDGKVNPDTIQYIECHGTGTPLGDPIEIAGLDNAFSHQKRNSDLPCLLGGVKANIGHCDKAAGVAGFIKTCLMIYEKVIPPQIHFKKFNSKILKHQNKFVISTKSKRWPNSKLGRRAGVSSFGIGGTNAHVIIGQSPVQDLKLPKKKRDEMYLFPFSGNTEIAFQQNCRAFLEFLSKYPCTNLQHLSLALQTCRDHFSYRKSFVCKTVDQLTSILKKEIKPNFHDKESFLTLYIDGVKVLPLSVAKAFYRKNKIYKSCFDALSQVGGNRIKVKSFIHTYAYCTILLKSGLQPKRYSGRGLGKAVALTLQDPNHLSHVLRVLTLYEDLLVSIKHPYDLIVHISKKEWKTIFSKYIRAVQENFQGSHVVVKGNLSSLKKIEKQLETKKLSYHKLFTPHYKREFSKQFCFHDTNDKLSDPNEWIALFEEVLFDKKDIPSLIDYGYCLVLGEKDIEVILSQSSIASIKKTVFSHIFVLSLLWEKGFDFKWHNETDLYFVKKLSAELPKYQFEATPCWVDKKTQKTTEDRKVLIEVDSTELEENVGKLFCEVLGCEKLSKTKSYFELGGDSLSALHLAKQVSGKFEIKVSSAALFRYDTVVDLSRYVKTLLEEKETNLPVHRGIL